MIARPSFIIKLSFLSLFLCLSLHSLAANPAATGKLLEKFAEYLADETHFSTLLSKHGIITHDADQIKLFTKRALTSLNKSATEPKSATEIIKIADELNLTAVADDNRRARALMEALASNPEQMDDMQIKEALNNLYYLASRYGKRGSFVLACASCVDDSLAKHGFRYTLEEIGSRKAQYVMKNYIQNKDSRQLAQFISSKLSKYNINYQKEISQKSISLEDERTLALFLGLQEHGTVEQKAYIKQVFEVSEINPGEYNLFKHRFWANIVTNEEDKKLLTGWTNLLKDVKAKMMKEQLETEEAWLKVLEERAGKDNYLQEQLRALQAKRCFFR